MLILHFCICSVYLAITMLQLTFLLMQLTRSPIESVEFFRYTAFNKGNQKEIPEMVWQNP